MPIKLTRRARDAPLVERKTQQKPDEEPADERPKTGPGSAQREAGNAFIRAREKAESRGAGRREAVAIANQQTSDIGKDTFKPQLAQQFQETIGAPVAIADEIPQIGAGPDDKKVAFGVPVVSEVGEAAELTAQTAQQTNLLRSIQEGSATPDDIRLATGRFGLTPLDMEVIRAGEADISKTAQLVEGIPFLPSQVKQFVALFGSPSKEVKEIESNMATTQEKVVLWSDLAKNNPLAAGRYVQLINKAEEEMIRMQSRIKIMSIQSPIIQSNPEQIIDIQTRITQNLDIVQGKREELALLGIS